MRILQHRLPRPNSALMPFILCLAAFASSALHAQPTYPVPSGVYCSCGPTMATGQGSVDPAIAAKPFVRGILVRVAWSLLEPEDNVFNFQQLDAQLERARTYGKKVALSVVNGPSCPAWLYTKGAAHVMVGAPYNDTIPYPWDSVYLAEWRALVAEVGRRYASDTTITIVHMTNSSANGFEFFLNPTGLFDWNTVGYSDAKMIASWKAVVDAFGAAFPNHYLDNDFHPVFLTANSSNVPSDSVFEYAARTLGMRYGAFSSWWSQKNTTSYAAQYADLLTSARSTFATVQFAYNGTRDSAAFGPGGMPGALQRAIDDGICYWEIWNQDILNRAFDSLLTNASCASVGEVRSVGEPGMRLTTFPNPGRDRLVVQFAEPIAIPTRLALVDPLGRAVATRDVAGGSDRVELDVARLPRGAYLLNVTSANRTVAVQAVMLTE